MIKINKNKVLKELFMNDLEDYEIIPFVSEDGDKGYKFVIDEVTYSVFYVKADEEILFIAQNEERKFVSPTKFGKNQFIILSLVIKCFEKIINNGESMYYSFSGNTGEGLANIYTLIFNKLKSRIKDFVCFTETTNRTKYFYFIKQGYFTMHEYRNRIDDGSLFNYDPLQDNDL